jgi:Dolichyl-phosphate-mannose-protein mannosyltransferase
MKRPLLLLTLAGLALRVAFLLLEPASSLAGDEHTWTTWGAEVLAGPTVAFSPIRFRLIFYPPLYPYFIGAGYALFGSLAAVKACQVAISVLLVPAVGLLGSACFGRTPGLVAAGIAALYPELVWFSAHFWSETLFLVLLWWAFERIVAADASGRDAPALAAGLLWGLAILTRETPLYFTPVAAAWLALRSAHPRGPRRASLFVLVALLTVAPWTVRNWVVYRAFVPVSTAGALNLWQGNAPLTRQQVYDRYADVHGRIQKYRYAQRMGIEAVLKRQPLWIFEKVRSEMPLFWEADSLALIHIRRGAYGDVGPLAGAVSAVVVLAPYLLVVALFVAGTAEAALDRRVFLLLAFLAYYVLIHVATHGFARYRLPAMPVVFLFAAAAWCAWRDRSLPPFGAKRALAAAGLGLALAASIAPSLTSAWLEPQFRASEDGGESAE